MARTEEVAGALDGSYTARLRLNPPPPDGPGGAAGGRAAAYRVSAAYPVFRGGRLLGLVALSKSPRDPASALWLERSRLLWASLAVAALLVALSLAASFRIISPLKSLAARARRVAEGSSPEFRERRPGLTEPRELALLEESVGLMAEKLRRRSDYLKAFARGVSHEFKSPLSSIKGAMELLHEDSGGMPLEVRERFRLNILSDLSRLESLASKLLALARAEAAGPAPDAKADAAEIARGLCARLSGVLAGGPDGTERRAGGTGVGMGCGEAEGPSGFAGEEKPPRTCTGRGGEEAGPRQQGDQAGTGLEGGEPVPGTEEGGPRAAGQSGEGSTAAIRDAAIPPEPSMFTAELAPGPRELFLAADRDALETVLKNLLENAREAGARRATVTLSREGCLGSIEVTDDGPGVPSGDAARIFAPFFTTRGRKGGTGLGLPLCRTLLEPFRGELAFTAPSSFRVTAPIWKRQAAQGKGRKGG
ncbi:MAG: sensor histidine kinase [Deltaproteobacteria bacterium]|nr:sensor histidine kinase [Deltaproteobacteria bacterium]